MLCTASLRAGIELGHVGHPLEASKAPRRTDGAATYAWRIFWTCVSCSSAHTAFLAPDCRLVCWSTGLNIWLCSHAMQQIFSTCISPLECHELNATLSGTKAWSKCVDAEKERGGDYASDCREKVCCSSSADGNKNRLSGAVRAYNPSGTRVCSANPFDNLDCQIGM